MLDKERPDFVAVCPRHADQRVDMIKAACECGAKGIYGKALCPKLEECDWIKEACEIRDELALPTATVITRLWPSRRN